MSEAKTCGHERADLTITADYEPWKVCHRCYGALHDERRSDEWPAELRAKARDRMGLPPSEASRLP